MSNAHGRVLGVDLGSKRIGLALSDPSRTIASPLTVLTRTKDPGADRRAVLAAASEHEATLVVVGHPLSLNGKEGPAAKAARAEADALRELGAGAISVVLHDERLTTVSAHDALRSAGVRGRDRTAVVDKVAAAVLLQAFLDGPGAR